MNHRTDYRQRLAEKGARALNRIAGGRFAPQPELLPPPLASYVYDAGADIVLVPIAWAGPRGLVPALSELRCTAILVMPGFTPTGKLTWYFTIARWVGEQLIWYSAFRLFIATDDKIWLVTNPADVRPEPIGLCLEKSWLRQGAVPWSSIAEWQAGVARGQVLLRQIAEQD